MAVSGGESMSNLFHNPILAHRDLYSLVEDAFNGEPYALEARLSVFARNTLADIAQHVVAQQSFLEIEQFLKTLHTMTASHVMKYRILTILFLVFVRLRHTYLMIIRCMLLL